MNQKELTKSVAKKTSLSPDKAQKLVESFGTTIEAALKRGERVVYSNFGSFYLVNYPSKVITHPATKKKMLILAANSVKWMPSDNIRDLVDHHLVTESATGFCSTKITREAKKSAGIPDHKATEITKEEASALYTALHKIDDETIEIPIRVSQSPWMDRPVPTRQNAAEIEIKPYSKKLQVEFIDLAGAKIPQSILCLVPKEIAHRTKVVPIDLKDEIVILGMTDPHDHDTIAALQKLIRKKISPRLVAEADLANILAQYEVSPELPAASQELKIDSKNPIARIVKLILKKAVREKASAIHFDPKDKIISVKFRVGGELIEKTTLPLSLQKQLGDKLRSMLPAESDRNTTTINFHAIIDNEREDFELSSLPVNGGEKFVIKIIDRLKHLKKLTELDLNSDNFTKITQSLGGNGLVVIASLNKRIRSELFYAMASYLAEQKQNTITLEHNPALVLKGGSQIDLAKGTFNIDKCVQAISNLDCDAIMLDQLTTESVAKVLPIATEKLVIVSVSTTDSFEAMARLVSLGCDSNFLAQNLKAIIASTEIDQLCPSCKKSTKLDSVTIKQIREIMSSLPSAAKATLRKLGSNFFIARGCVDCNKSGYSDQLKLYEVLAPTEKIKKLITEKAGLAQIRKAASASGFTSLTQEGLIKALSGLTTAEEALNINLV